MIAKAQQTMAGSFQALASMLGRPQDRLTKGRLIEFTRYFDHQVPELLRPLVVEAYGIGVQKARHDDHDRAPIEVHASQAAEWMHRVRDRITGLSDAMLSWYDRHSLRRFREQEGGDDPEDSVTVGVFIEMFSPDMGTVGLGLWTVYQAGYVAGVGGSGGDVEDGVVLLNYIAVGDQNTCGPCQDAADASPYTPDSVPYPGDVCDGGDNCRCEIEEA